MKITKNDSHYDDDDDDDDDDDYERDPGRIDLLSCHTYLFQ